MGEGQGWLFEPSFNRSVKVRHSEQRLSSDAGVLLLREVDHRLALIESLAGRMVDPRDQDGVRYTQIELLRERLYALALGYRVQDDLDRLAHDPLFKIAVWDRPGQAVLDQRLASQPTQSRLLGMLADRKQNLEALRGSLSGWVERHLRAAGQDRAVRRGTIDLDSFPIEVHGHQPGGAYNGYYKQTVYHPLIASFSCHGDYDAARLGEGFVHAVLRQGCVASAKGVGRFMGQVLVQSRSMARCLDFRFDAAFAVGGVMDPLAEAGHRFVGRLPLNRRLQDLAARYLVRPVGRPPAQGYGFVVELGEHRADTWRHAHRLVLVVVDQPDPKTGQLQLQPRYFFLVTNWPPQRMDGEQLLAHYRRRGTFEDRLGEFNQAIAPRLSSPDFAANEATLLLSLLAYNLAGIVRGQIEQATPCDAANAGRGWDLARLQNTVLKAGARVVRHSRRLVVDLASAVKPLWLMLIQRIRRWVLPRRFAKPHGPRYRPWIPPPVHAHLSCVLNQ